LVGADGFEKCQIAVGASILGAVGVVALDDVIRENGERIGVSSRCEVLKGADANVTLGDAAEDGSWPGCFSVYKVAGGHRSEGPGGRDAESVEGLADQVLAEHGAECGTAIAAAGESGWSSALELDIAERSVGKTDFPEEHGASITELGHEVSELVACVSLRDRSGAREEGLARADLLGRRGKAETEALGERLIESNEGWSFEHQGLSLGRKVLAEASIDALEQAIISW
jgi:hypothetical protein